MDEIKNIYQALNEQELKLAVLEISEMNETGICRADGVLMKVKNQISKVVRSRQSIDVVAQSITWEISRRWYNERYGTTEKIIEE